MPVVSKLIVVLLVRELPKPCHESSRPGLKHVVLFVGAAAGCDDAVLLALDRDELGCFGS